MISRRALLERMVATGMISLLCAAGAAWAQDNATGPTVPPSAAAGQTASQAAEETWPPGLFMKFLENAGVRKPLDDAGIRVWGFLEGGITFDLAHGARTLFGRGFDARRVGDPRLNQFRVSVDRPYDSTKTFDWGFRVDTLFGGDALITHTAGLLYHAGEGTGDAWFDILQLYAQGWFKTGDGSGLEVTFGKFLTPLGYETIDATGNPLYSHSLLHGFAQPGTHTGVKLNYVFNKQLSAYVGLVKGWDVFRDNNDAPSYLAGFALSGAEQIDDHARNQFWFNVITGPEQPDDVSHFRTVFDASLTHWWTGKLSSTLNGDFGTESHAGSDGRARWYGVAHYLTYVFSDRVSATWRAEWFHDSTGSRIGARGDFYENTLGLNLTPWPAHKVLKNLSIRPEIRWDISNEKVFADSHNQVTAAVDVIFKF